MLGEHHVAIVGTGFAGLCMGIRLRQAGHDDFTILERAPRLGGVWRDNHYPGVACDIESHLYSYSFAPNPEWSRAYAPAAEILAYLERCAARYDLERHIRFDTAVTGARFDEPSGMWEITLGDGGTLRARVLVSGSGHALSTPVLPAIPGIERFSGKTFHSARWDHGVPLAGKRVAVIGTGASAIQIVPNLAPDAGTLHVFQRTAPWIIPKRDHAIPPEWRERYRRWPWLQKLARTAIYWRHELLGAGFVLAPGINRLGERLARAHLHAQVADSGLRARLTPDYALGCKRVLLSNDYYPALTRPNVELVTDPIREVREHSIVTADGRERPLEAIVYATGFVAADAVAPFSVRGLGGRDLNQAWSGGTEAYLGTAISGFPNLFLILGPNTGLGHSSMVFMIESQVQYILGAIRTLRDRELSHVDVLPDAQARYNRRLQSRLAHTVWASGCNSWYLARDGRNTVLWPGFTVEFRLRTRRFNLRDYAARALQPSSPPSGRAISASRFSPHSKAAPIHSDDATASASK